MKDFLSKKSKHLSKMQAKSQTAIDMVTRTIAKLRAANEMMACDRDEMTAYAADIAAKQVELADAMAKNDRIIENFSRLIEA